jgi:hypothetical protein
MKYLILTLVFLYVNLGAKNYISVQGLQDCKNGTPYKIYMRNATDRYNITGKDCETHTIQDVQVDDIDKPIYAARTNETDCQLYPEYDSQSDDCRFLTEIANIGTDEDPIYEPVLCTDKSYFPAYADKADFGLGVGFFAYCTKRVGYEQKTVKKLLPDQVLIDAKNAALLDKLDEDKVREILDLIKDRDALTQIIDHNQIPQKYKDKATVLRQAINTKLQEFFGQ